MLFEIANIYRFPFPVKKNAPVALTKHTTISRFFFWISDDEALKPYECGLCPGVKFSTAEGLGKHVDTLHSKSTTNSKPSSPKKVQKGHKKTKEITEEVIDEVTDEFANEVANIEAKSKNKTETVAKKTALQISNGKFYAHLQLSILKFIYSEKATKFCEIFTVDLTVTT